MEFFENKSINSNTDKFFSSVNVHVYEKKHIKGFKNLIRSVSHINGVHIENATKLLYKTPEKKKEKKSLFDRDKLVWWRKYWKNMPHFEQKQRPPLLSTKVYFETKKGMQIFADKVDQNISEKTKFIHFPTTRNAKKTHINWRAEKEYWPKYPIYIISKGRWESRLTSKMLEKIGVPYHIVVEPQEYKQYNQYIDSEKILVTPFSNLGQGSIPVRNWVWQHAVGQGADRHWILDDNICSLYRLHKNTRYRVWAPNPFYIIEQFVDRYTNIGLAGMHYKMFAPDNEKRPPFYLNSRIYSFILINHKLDQSLNERWRGRFNEDTDLSLRVMKNDWCTILFNQFLCDKIATMRMKGGNTEELYEQTNNRLEFAKSLKKQHPNLVQIIERWGRYHHYVDYSGFKQKPKLKKNINIPDKTNEFGLKLVNDENKQTTSPKSFRNSQTWPGQ